MSCLNLHRLQFVEHGRDGDTGLYNSARDGVIRVGDNESYGSLGRNVWTRDQACRVALDVNRQLLYVEWKVVQVEVRRERAANLPR